MITDEMLYEAAPRVHEALLSTLPNSTELEHQFSKRFERRMRKLVRKTKYPYVYHTLKAVACIFIIIVLGATLFLTANVKAREAFFKWVKEQYECFIEYYFDGMVDDDSIVENSMAEYRLGWVPEGYVESEVFVSYGKTTIIYTNSTDSIIFSYYPKANYTNLFIKEDFYKHSSTKLNNFFADIYLAHSNDESNIIICTNAEENLLFSISSFLDEDILIKLVENIK